MEVLGTYQILPLHTKPQNAVQEPSNITGFFIFYSKTGVCNSHGKETLLHKKVNRIYQVKWD